MRSRIILITAVLSLFVLSAESFALTVSFGGVRLNKKVKPLKQLKDKNVIRQSLDYSCGPAGLATLLNYYLLDPISEQQIIEALLSLTDLEKVKERKGFSLYDLKRFAQSRGYKVTGYKMDMEFLKGLGKPVLIPIKFKNFRHFVVVKGVVGDRVFFADPASGNMTMKITRLESIWQDGIGLVVEAPGRGSYDYPLRAKMEEAVIADYRNIKRNLESAVIRTAVFIGEF